MSGDDDKRRRFDAAADDLKLALGRIAAEHGNGVMFAAALTLLARAAVGSGENRKGWLAVAGRAYEQARRGEG